MPGLLDANSEAELLRALWLGRTPQVHTFGMAQPIAVVTAGVTERGRRRRRPSGIRLLSVEVMEPGRLGGWSWPPPITIECHPAAATRLGLVAGLALHVDWDLPGGSVTS